jgi:hypothetical protein
MPSLRRLRKAPVPVASLLCLLISVSSATSQEYRVGVFFDDSGQTCVGEIRNFGSDVRAHIFAVVPEGTEMNGAVLGLDLPPGIILREVTWAKNVDAEGNLVSRSGLDFTFLGCPPATGPVLLASLVLYQSDDNYEGGVRVPDIQLLLRGGVTAADSVSYVDPQVKICSGDPLGGDPDFVRAPSYRATLNCSSNCPCETSVMAKTWGWVKSLFREP